MNKMLVKGLLLLSVIFLLGASSCGGGIAQADYDSIKDKLAQAETQIKTLQDKLTAAAATTTTTTPTSTVKPTTDTTVYQIQSLQTQITALEAAKKAAETNYNDLNVKYTALQKQYSEATKTSEMSTDQVEQAIFTLINKDRTSNNVTALKWGENLSKITKQNGKDMYNNSRYEPSSWPIYQEIHWAAGYSSADRLAEGTLMVWKNFEYKYAHGVLSKAFTYGAVGAYQVGDVFYITFAAADYP
jgi:hypothetical protein